MKKVMLAVVLLSLSGAASAASWSANGFRMIQVMNSTNPVSIGIKQDGFAGLQECEDFIQAQKNLLPASGFKTPAQQNAITSVFARCDLVKP